MSEKPERCPQVSKGTSVVGSRAVADEEDPGIGRLWQAPGQEDYGQQDGGCSFHHGECGFVAATISTAWDVAAQLGPGPSPSTSEMSITDRIASW